MKREQRVLLLAAGFLAFLLAVFRSFSPSASLLEGLTAAGAGLRQLSLSGFPGNLCAWCIVYLLSSLPLLLMLWQWRLWRRSGSDWLAGLSALLIFLGLFALVNPTLFQGQWTALLTQLPSLSFWSAALSVLVCWLVLRILKKLEGSGFEALGHALSILLNGAGVLIVFSAVYSAASGCAAAFQAAQENVPSALNTALGANSQIVELSQNSILLFCALTLLELLPSLLGAVVLLWGSTFAQVVTADPFSAEAVELCERTARGCRRVVQWSVVLSLCSNLVQLAALPYMSQVNFSIHIPLFTLILSTALFLLCLCFQRGRALQEDNDSII